MVVEVKALKGVDEEEEKEVDLEVADEVKVVAGAGVAAVKAVEYPMPVAGSHLRNGKKCQMLTRKLYALNALTTQRGN